jgi:hypothetical protein
MSQLEVAKNSPTTYCFQYAAMGSVDAGNVAGKASPTGANPIANFFPACSKVVGVERVVSAGTVGNVYLTTAAVIAGAGPLPTLTSSNALDTSTYAIFWTNQVAYSPNQVILPC